MSDKVMAVSVPVYDRIMALRAQRITELGRSVTVTEVLEDLIREHDQAMAS